MAVVDNGRVGRPGGDTGDDDDDDVEDEQDDVDDRNVVIIVVVVADADADPVALADVPLDSVFFFSGRANKKDDVDDVVLDDRTVSGMELTLTLTFTLPLLLFATPEPVEDEEGPPLDLETYTIVIPSLPFYSVSTKYVSVSTTMIVCYWLLYST